MADSSIGRNLAMMLESTKDLTLDALSHASSVSTMAINSAANPMILADFINGGSNPSSASQQSKRTISTSQLIFYLNSSNDKEKLIALKYIVKLLSFTESNSLTNSGNHSSISKENELLKYFPHVIKNINTTNIKIKRLVFIYLLRLNHLQPDTALLSINAIQKSLSDKDCISRALSIRCLSGIKIPAILPILLLSIKKTITDFSPLVRSSSAIAIVKCYELDKLYNSSINNNNNNNTNGSTNTISDLKDENSTISTLYRYLNTLLSDNDPKVLSSALITYKSLFNGNFDLIHNKLNHLISKLPQLEDFSQVISIDLLTDYCKLFIKRPEIIDKNQNQVFNLPNLNDGTDNYKKIFSKISNYEIKFDPIIDLILNNLKILNYSNSYNVILSISKFLINLTSPNYMINEFKLNKSLLRILNLNLKNQFIKILILQQFSYIVNFIPNFIDNSKLSSFYPNYYYLNYKDFKINFKSFKLKISILLNIINSNNFNQIFSELKNFINTLNTNIILINDNKIIDQNNQQSILITYKKLTINLINQLCFNNDLNNDQINLVLNWYLSKLNLLKTSNNISNSNNDSNNDLKFNVSDELISEYITGIRFIIQKDLISNIDILINLVGKIIPSSSNPSLTSIEDPIAKSSIIWLLGEYSNYLINNNNNSNSNSINNSKILILGNFLPDVLRLLTINFLNESSIVKLQILIFAAKLYSKDLYEFKLSNTGSETYNFNSILFKLFNIILHYCKYDSNLDIRDRSRLIGSLLPNLIFTIENLQPNNLKNFNDFFDLNNFENQLIIEKLNLKLHEVELSALILQVSKSIDFSFNNHNNSLAGSKSSSSSLDSLDLYILKYNYSIKFNDDLLNNEELLNYYNELRNESLEIKDYDKQINSISSKNYIGNNNIRSFSSSSSSLSSGGFGNNGFGNGNGHGRSSFSSPQPQFNNTNNNRNQIHNSIRSKASKKYNLQSLDDFLGDDEYDVNQLLPDMNKKINKKVIVQEEEDVDSDGDEGEEALDDDNEEEVGEAKEGNSKVEEGGSEQVNNIDYYKDSDDSDIEDEHTALNN